LIDRVAGRKGFPPLTKLLLVCYLPRDFRQAG